MPYSQEIPASLPAWAEGLPREAIPAPSEVPPLEGRKIQSFEMRWRGMTIARLYGLCGWTFARIAKHFGFAHDERARQVCRTAGYYGERGKMESTDPTQWRAQFDQMIATQQAVVSVIRDSQEAE
ncbi:MAG: hypothetical protein ACREMZ_16425 [Gemmatimonadales bacterium]